eukprot:5749962-Prymnesium_polylepis.1
MFGPPRQGRTARLGARDGCAREEHTINNNEGKRQPRGHTWSGSIVYGVSTREPTRENKNLFKKILATAETRKEEL